MSATNTPALDVDVPGLGELFMGGAWCAPASERIREVVVPSTEETVATVAEPSVADADLAAQAARRAFDDGPWPRMSAQERVGVCRRFTDELIRREEDLKRAWIFEAGPTIAHAEILSGAAPPLLWNHAMQVAPELPWREERVQDAGRVILRREPIGPALAILTYNGPVILVGMKVIPALLAGCPVVMKFAPESQLTSRIIADCALAAGFPDGVIGCLAADIEVTKHLVAHPAIDMIAVTGGTPIGMEVAGVASKRLARTLLFLGGKGAAIIAPDADVEHALTCGLVDGCTGYLGQVCVTMSRVLVPRARYDEIVTTLGDRFAALKVGDPFDPSSDRGPLAVERARTRTEHYVALAQEHGARVVTGGRRPPELDRGWFYEPTLLADVTNDMPMAQEEIFGPVTCAIAYDDLDDAVQIANDTRYGLSAAVFSHDEAAAMQVAERLRVGAVAINAIGVSLTEPFGGVKQSGWGRECGAEGILDFTDIKQILLSGSYMEA